MIIGYHVVYDDASTLYRQQEWRFTLEHDYWGSNGSEGYSKLRAHTTMLQLIILFIMAVSFGVLILCT